MSEPCVLPDVQGGPGHETPSQNSDSPVGYATGTVDLSITMLRAGDDGLMGHTIAYINTFNPVYGGPSGFNWTIKQLPFLTLLTNGEVIANVDQKGIRFSPSPSDPNVYDSYFTGLAENGIYEEYRLSRDASGNFVFVEQQARPIIHYVLPKDTSHGYGIGVRQILPPLRSRKITFNNAGIFKTYIRSTEGSDPILDYEAVSYTGNRVNEIRSVNAGAFGGRVYRSIVYTYYTSGANQNRLEYITYRSAPTLSGAWTTLKRLKCEYYGSGEANGAVGDLKRTTVQYPNGTGGWNDVAVRYNRYWDLGLTHMLKYTFGPEAYSRMVANGITPETASNASVAPYADYYFEYDSTTKRVTKEIANNCSACGVSGTPGDTFTYQFQSPVPTDVNAWAVKTTITHGNNTVSRVYTNKFGQVIFKAFEDRSVTPYPTWYWFYKYDSGGRLTLSTNNGVTGEDGANASPAKIFEATNANLLSDGSGAFYIFEYYATGSESQGYLANVKIKHGETGTPIALRRQEWTQAESVGMQLLSKIIKYPEDSNTTTKMETVFTYTPFATDATKIQKRKIQLAPVLTTQNGSGTSDEIEEVFDLAGRVLWYKDERGAITRYSYETLTSNPSQMIEDVDTSITTDEPTGWVTKTGWGRHLITDYEYDVYDRLTQTLGPSHTAIVSGTATTVRSAVWRTYQYGTGTARDEYRTGYGYATGTAPNYTYTLINPVEIEKRDNLGRITDEISAVRSSTAGKLALSDTFAQSSWTRWTTYQYDSKGLHTSTRVYHTIPSSGEGTSGTNYDQTTYGYDSRHKLVKVVSPGGTITRRVLNVLDKDASLWIGTNDTGATAADPSGGGASGNNMKKLAELQYDGGSANGPQNLTQVKVYEDATNTRTTDYNYDWRNRRIAVDGEEGYYLTIGYDNLARPTLLRRREGGVTGTRLAEVVAAYDDQDRLFRTTNYPVDSAGNVDATKALTSNYWHDAGGNLIKAVGSGSGAAFAKLQYDALGSATKMFVGFDVDESAYSEAQDVAGDTIAAQVEAEYDAGGNQTAVTRRDRLHDATGEGELTTPAGANPKARVTHSAAWYDAVGRVIAAADYGTNEDSGGVYQAFTRPSTPPSSSDTVLVSTAAYSDSGPMDKLTDPKGIESRLAFDHVGRRTKVTEAYDDGDPATGSADRDRTTEYTYTADSLPKTLTVRLSSTNYQTTEYVYEARTSSGSGVNRNDVLTAVKYPDPSTGDASASHQETFKVNRLGERTGWTDRRGTVHAYSYDKLGRLMADEAMTLGTNVDGTVRKLGLTYDVLGRAKKLTSYDGSSAVVNEVERSYNDFGRLITEHQEHSGAVNTGTSAKVQYAWSDGSNNHVRPTKLTYPNGRIVRSEYSSGADDTISRLSFLADDNSGAVGTHLEEYAYVGAGLVVVRDRPQPQVKLDLWGGASGTYSGIDRFSRITDQRLSDYGASAHADRFAYGYDRNSNRLYRENLLSSAHSELYHANGATNGYDSLDRLSEFRRGTLSDTNSDNVPDTVTTASRTQAWTLDALGNWSSLSTDGTPVGRTHDKQNRLTQVGSNNLTYSANGEMTMDETGQSLVYDAWGRLLSAGTQTYAYDAMNRRIKEGSAHLYYSAGWQVLEERNSSGSATMQYVWSPVYVDAMVLRDRDTDANGSLDERLYVQHDANFNVTSITDTLGDVVERYVYDPYGLPSYLDASWNSRTSSSYDWTYLHQGGRYDTTAGLYHFRFRDLDPILGRWTRQDPLGYVDGASLYEYVGSSPANYLDPEGLQRWYEGWGTTIYVAFGGYGSDAAGQVWTAAGQGAADGGMAWANGAVPFVDPFSDDWFYDKCDPSLAWSEAMGHVSRDAWLLAAGIHGGTRMAGAAGRGKEFSHAIPSRWGGPRTMWNGNYVTTAKHALSDPYRYRFMPRAWKALNPMSHRLSQLWNRIPYTWKGTAIGLGLGTAAEAADQYRNEDDCGQRRDPCD